MKFCRRYDILYKKTSLRVLLTKKEFVMLDLVFLVLMIIVLMKSLKGDLNILLCNIAAVVGFIAGLVGIVGSFFSQEGNSFFIGLLNILVIIIAVILKPVAKYLVRAYQNQIDEQVRLYAKEVERAQANFNRSAPRDNTYINNPAEQQPASSQENPTANFAPTANGFPQENSGAFHGSQNIAAAKSFVFPQNANTAANPESVVPTTDSNSGVVNSCDLPSDLNVPIDLGKKIDDIPPDFK